MRPIKLQTWILWAVTLFVLGLLADYYFLHIMFKEKQISAMKAAPTEPGVPPGVINGTQPDTIEAAFDDEEDDEVGDTEPVRDNFLVSLQKCAPEISAQAVATPEALMEYLKKTVGIKSEDISIENYHLSLSDGSQRRVHVVTSDNSNTPGKKEIRFFKLDAEGVPERIPLKGDETLESLLALGKLQNREVKSQLALKDGGNVSLEMHDNKVFEFQYSGHGKVLSCRVTDCQCP